MLQDLRHAVRSLIRTPWASAAIVLSLGIGTGANAAVYSALDALLFRGPAGVENPGTLVEIYTSQINGATYGSSSYPDFLSLRGAAALEMAAFDDRGETELRLGGARVNARATAVSEDFWHVLGATPYLGRWPGDAQADADAAVVSFELWRSLDEGRRAVGTTVDIGGRSCRIVAVAPPHFHGLHPDRIADIWLPFDAATRTSERGHRRLQIVARVASSGRLEDLQSSLTAASESLARRFPETNAGTIRTSDEPRRFSAVPYSRVNPAVRTKAGLLAAVLLGATGLLLLSASVNAGSLLLSRGLARRLELAIKTALGADRARLIRVLLIESCVLALAGAAAGLLAAAWTSGALPALFAPEQARLLDTQVQPRVILVTMIVGIAAGLLLGLGPAVASTRSLAADIVRGGAASIGERPRGTRLRMALVSAQLALSTIFIIESGLLARVIDTSLRIDRSTAAGSTALAWIETYDPAYRDKAMPLLLRLASPSHAGWVSIAPLERSTRRQFRIERGAVSEPAEFDVNYASAGYFSTMFIPLIDGRLFTAADESAGGVAIVSEALAQRYFAESAVGHDLTDALGNTVHIIGVVRTFSYRALEASPEPVVYYPMSQATARGFYAIVRGPHPDTAARLEQALRSAGGATSLQVSTLDAQLARALTADRLIVTLVRVCGLIALGLAVIGAYGILADSVRRRTREIGLRLALGAGPWQIVWALSGVALVPVLAGLAAGVAGAELMVRLARAAVFGLPSIDASLLVKVTAGLSLVVFAVVLPPARRALRIDPSQALREHAETAPR